MTTKNIDATGEQDEQSTQPRGGRIGVAYDWGFAVQLALTGGASLVGRPLGPMLPLGLVLVVFGLAAAMLALGEGLRRGNRLAWRLQIVFNSLLSFAGLVAILPTLLSVQEGRFAPLYTLFLLLGVSSAEVWLLLQPGSRRWYGAVDPQVARARHGGGWLVGTIIWAIVGGILQTLAVVLR